MGSNRENERRKTEDGRAATSPSSIVQQPAASNHQPAFTLLEVLVSLVIFGILTVALSTAMSTSLRTKVQFEQQQEDSETVRAVFATLGRDMQSAFGSKNDPNSLFVAGSSGSGSQSTSKGALLQFSALTHRISTSDPSVDPSVNIGGAAVSSAQGVNDPPQQPTELVRYDLDPQAGTLSRLSQPVPNLQTFQEATPAPDNIIASNIVSLTLQFWDTTQQTWRDDWDFEQPNLPPPATAATTLGYPTSTGTSTSGAAGSTGGAAGGAASQSTGTGTGDIQLPSAVQIKLIIRRKNGTPGTYTAIVPVVAAPIQDYPYTGGQTTDITTSQISTTTSGTGGGQ